MLYKILGIHWQEVLKNQLNDRAYSEQIYRINNK